MTQSTNNPLDPQEWTEAPSEFDDETVDLAGYWESAGPETRTKEETFGSPPVTFTPLYVTLSDSDIDGKKSSTLLHCRLEAPCLLKSSTKGEGYREFPAGTTFGIWTKPGMKPLKKLAGVKCWMRNGQKIGDKIVYFKDVNKPSPMVLFTIKWPKTAVGSFLEVREDFRKTSLPEHEKLRRKAKEERAQEIDDTDDLSDIPF